MAIDMNAVREMAVSDAVYWRGVHLSLEGRVLSLKHEDRAEGARLRAVVAGGSRYHVRVDMDKASRVLDYNCDCPTGDSYDGLCKHCVAVLHQARNESQQANIAATPKEKPTRTDQAANYMLQAYATREAVQVAMEMMPADEKITLVPTMEFNYALEGPRLSFTLGNRRQYVLKDIHTFVMSMRRAERVAYGKQLEFIHSPESFAEESQPLLRFIMENNRETLVPRPSYQLYRADAEGRYLHLPPPLLDRFFALWAGKTLSVQLSKGNQTLHLAAANPAFQAAVSVQGKGGMTLTIQPFMHLRGENHVYMLQGDAFLQCDTAFTQATAAFLRAMVEGKFALQFAKKDLPLFCANVWPKLQPYVTFTGRVDLLEQFEPLPLNATLNFDAPSHDLLTCAVEFAYGEETFDPIENQTPSLRSLRDHRAEARVQTALAQYLPNYDPTMRKLWIREAEQRYLLISEGIPKFMALATVRVSDRFSRIDTVAPPKIAIGVSLQGDLLELTFDAGTFPREELAAVLAAYRERRKYYELNDGSFLRLEESAFAGLADIQETLALDEKDIATGQATVQSHRALSLDRLMHAHEQIRFDRDAAFKRLVRGIKAAEDSEMDVPALLAPILRNYQRTGYRWLRTLEEFHFSGILADDMGLGKTLQVIALLLHAQEMQGLPPSLVICPASLVLNWADELTRFAPSLPVRAILGDAAQRAQLISNIAPGEVVLTSYDLLKRDIEHYAGREFHYEIIDEAQWIKNHTTYNAKAVKAIRSRQRFAMTGTPVENRLSELWSIFDYLMPGYLFTYAKFKKNIETPIVKEEHSAARMRLHHMVTPFILRRLKGEVLKELPPKTETVIRVPLDGEQQKIYQANAIQARKKFAETVAEEGLSKNRIAILALLTRLRQLCCDPALCYEDYQGPSAKLEACMDLLQEAVAGGHKVLLFSQFTTMLARIADRLTAVNIRYSLLQGDTPTEKRLALVKTFNEDDTGVFLISLRAGGTGLNLTGADIVIHYDPWWNLAAQNQATDRAHRIGQRSSVQVYKLIAQDTVEEKILLLQEAKAGLADSILTSGEEAAIFSLTEEQMMAMFSE